MDDKSALLIIFGMVFVLDYVKHRQQMAQEKELREFAMLPWWKKMRGKK